MEFHEYAALMPMMASEEFDTLCEDIKTNGLKEPIVLYEDQILDGRNRYLACQAVGARPVFVEFEGDDPVGAVLSGNLHRRHLTTGQRAYSAVKYFSIVNIGEGDSRAAVCKQFRIGHGTFDKARKLQEFPELFEALGAGRVKLDTAIELIVLQPEYYDRAIKETAGLSARLAKEYVAARPFMQIGQEWDESQDWDGYASQLKMWYATAQDKDGLLRVLSEVLEGLSAEG